MSCFVFFFQALSDKLDLSPDTLRSWRRLHEQKVVELKQRLNDKKVIVVMFI